MAGVSVVGVPPAGAGAAGADVGPVGNCRGKVAWGSCQSEGIVGMGCGWGAGTSAVMVAGLLRGGAGTAGPPVGECEGASTESLVKMPEVVQLVVLVMLWGFGGLDGMPRKEATAKHGQLICSANNKSHRGCKAMA
eukprot:1137398-Pelagomonas_calceolata.AAC.3